MSGKGEARLAAKALRLTSVPRGRAAEHLAEVNSVG